MDDPGTGDSWIRLIAGLPPAVQGIAAFGVAVGVGLVLGRRFLRRLKVEPEPPKLYGAGDISPLTDLEPVISLIGQLDLLTQHVMKNEVATAAFTGQVSVVAERLDGLIKEIGRLADITGQLLLDFRQEREERADAAEKASIREDARQELLEEQRNAPPPRRRPRRTNRSPVTG